MTQSVHPGERIIEIIRRVIVTAHAPSSLVDAKEIWCGAHGKNVRDTEGFVESVRQFQDILDEWRRDSLVHSFHNPNYVNKIYNDLNYVMLNLGGESRDEFVEKLQSLETAIGMGVVTTQVHADFQWELDIVEELLAEVTEWKTIVLKSTMEPVWKRNILEALDNVLEAIANHEARGDNHLTDAVIRLKAILNLPQVVIRLSQVGMEIGSWAIDVIEKIGGPPALPPGASE